MIKQPESVQLRVVEPIQRPEFVLQRGSLQTIKQSEFEQLRASWRRSSSLVSCCSVAPGKRSSSLNPGIGELIEVQVVNFPGPRPIEELTKVPTVSTESGVVQRMVKQTVNPPGPMAMDERTEVPRVSAGTSGQCAWSSRS